MTTLPKSPGDLSIACARTISDTPEIAVGSSARVFDSFNANASRLYLKCDMSRFV
jgi:hypothetical protein